MFSGPDALAAEARDLRQLKTVRDERQSQGIADHFDQDTAYGSQPWRMLLDPVTDPLAQRSHRVSATTLEVFI